MSAASLTAMWHMNTRLKKGPDEINLKYVLCLQGVILSMLSPFFKTICWIYCIYSVLYIAFYCFEHFEDK